MMTGKQLAQRNDADTSTHSVYSPAADIEDTILINLANTTATAATVWVYHDDDGTTYDATTAIVPNITIPAYTVIQIGPVYMNDSTGNLAFKQGTSGAITITLYSMQKS